MKIPKYGAIGFVLLLFIGRLGLPHTPMHPERDLRAASVQFEAGTAFRDLFANRVVVDGRIVTGQNQNSATETAVMMMRTLCREPVNVASSR